jgi:hypothetical protein
MRRWILIVLIIHLAVSHAVRGEDEKVSSAQVADAQAIAKRRIAELRAASDVLQRRIASDPQWSAAEARLQQAGAALSAARDGKDTAAVRRAELAVYRAQQEMTQVSSLLEKKDADYQAAWAAMCQAQDDLRALQQRFAASTQPSTVPATAATTPSH